MRTFLRFVFGIPDSGGNSQLDSDGDGNGNHCDPDYNQNNVVDSNDAAVFVAHFGQNDSDPSWDPDIDLNGNGVIDSNDAAIFVSSFGDSPGPSGLVP